MLRYPGVCNGDPMTTVLAHINRGGVGGMGTKPHDLVAVWACSACHDEADGRTHYLDASERDTYTLEALCRQLDRYVREGAVKT